MPSTRLKPSFATAVVISLLLAASPSWAGKAHEHGSAKLEIATQGGEIEARFSGAADNFLSFEHAPKTPAQKAELDALKVNLARPGWLLRPNPEAACQQTSAVPKSPIFQAGSQQGHADIEVLITFQCKEAKSLRSIEVTAFEANPRMSKLRAEVLSKRGQRLVKLNRKYNKITL